MASCQLTHVILSSSVFFSPGLSPFLFPSVSRPDFFLFAQLNMIFSSFFVPSWYRWRSGQTRRHGADGGLGGNTGLSPSDLAKNLCRNRRVHLIVCDSNRRIFVQLAHLHHQRFAVDRRLISRPFSNPVFSAVACLFSFYDFLAPSAVIDTHFWSFLFAQALFCVSTEQRIDGFCWIWRLTKAPCYLLIISAAMYAISLLTEPLLSARNRNSFWCVVKTTHSIAACILRRVQSDVTELNWTDMV